MLVRRPAKAVGGGFEPPTVRLATVQHLVVNPSRSEETKSAKRHYTAFVPYHHPRDRRARLPVSTPYKREFRCVARTWPSYLPDQLNRTKVAHGLISLQVFYKNNLNFTIQLKYGYFYYEFSKTAMEKAGKNLEIDNVDLKILSLLMQDATMPYTEIGKRIFVSGGTVHVRMKKMEEMGVVRGSQLIVDYTRLGWDISAFLGIYLDKSSLYEDVARQLKTIPEVINIHYTTGIYSIFARIVCRDTLHLREVLHDKIQKVSGIQRTETFISLEESVNRPVPLQ